MDKVRKSSTIWGAVLIVLGLLLLSSTYFDLRIFSFANLWPLIVIALGLVFESSYFVSRRDPGLLVPGGILTIIGTLFLSLNCTSWSYMRYLWPFFPLSVAAGLFQLYLFGSREPGLLIPVTILFCVSAAAFSAMLLSVRLFAVMMPLLLIAAGLYIIFKGNRSR